MESSSRWLTLNIPALLLETIVKNKAIKGSEVLTSCCLTNRPHKSPPIPFAVFSLGLQKQNVLIASHDSITIQVCTLFGTVWVDLTAPSRLITKCVAYNQRTTGIILLILEFLSLRPSNQRDWEENSNFPHRALLCWIGTNWAASRCF